MSRINLVNPDTATGKAKDLLDTVSKKMGMVPNIMRAMANSPSVLQAYLGMSGALATGTLSPQVRELIALAVGQQNDCGYCLAAHSALAKMAGLAKDDILAGRRGCSDDPKMDAAVKFAVRMIEENGEVGDADVESLRAVGYTSGEIAEIVGCVCMNIFTNYFNHVADPPVDFPAAPPLD